MRLDYLRPNKTRRFRSFILCFVAVSTLTAAGCASTTTSPNETAPTTIDRLEPLREVPTPQLPVTVVNNDGTDITIDNVDRIIPLTGSIAEVVFTLGLGDNVVARDITATFEQAQDLPIITRGHDVSAESVLSLKPTLVIAEPLTGPAESIDHIEAAGVPVLVLSPTPGLEGIDTRIADIAHALGVDDAGDKLRERTADRLEAAVANIPSAESKPRVAFLYLRGSASVYMLGGTTSGITPLIEAVGAIDAGAEAGIEGDFVPITAEAMAAAAPDVILVMTKGLDSVGGIDGLVELPGIAQTPAGIDRRIASIDDGVILNYGPRTDEVLISLAEQIYADS